MSTCSSDYKWGITLSFSTCQGIVIMLDHINLLAVAVAPVTGMHSGARLSSDVN